MNLLELPSVMLEHIFSFLTYDQVAKNRIVCKDFNIICQRVLNRGFQMMEKRLAANIRAIKAQLPRRESERRCHPLARNCDILLSIETRFSMLSMAYSRFIEQGMCCFIPGKVLDEFGHVITIVDDSHCLPLKFEVLQELRDVSGMATEHFEDVVAPSLRQKMQEYAVSINSLPLVSRSIAGKKETKAPSVPALELALLRQACLKNNQNILKMEKKYAKLLRKLDLYKRIMTLNKRQMMHRQLEQSHQIALLKQKVEEYEIKFNELTLSQNTGYKTCIKETDTRNRIFNMITKTNKMLNVRMRLKNFGNQIKLDPSTSRIGLNRGGRGSPIIKPRRAGLLPSYKPEESPLINIPQKLPFLNSQSSVSQSNQLKIRAQSSPVKNIKVTPDYVQNVLNKMKNILNESQELIKNPKTSHSSLKPNSDRKEENAWLKNYLSSRMDYSLPSTSKCTDSSEDSDIQAVEFPEQCSVSNVTKSKKRTYSEACGQNDIPQTVADIEKGYHTKIHPLIMRLINTLSDMSDAKRKRAQNNEE